MRFTVSLLIFAAQALAQSLPDAAPLLGRQVQTLESYHSYQYTQEMSTAIKMPGMQMPAISVATMIQAVNPGKLRQETKTAGIAGSLTISDGENTWTYMALTNQYTTTAPDARADAIGQAGMKGITDNAKVTGSELLDVDGQQRDCWVIESKIDSLDVSQFSGPNGAIQDSVFTTWVDKASGMQWKTSLSGKVRAGAAMPTMDTKVTTLTHLFKINPDLDDSLFVFTPPAGAKETDNLFPGMPGLTQGAAAVKQTPAAAKQTLPAPGEPEAYVPQLEPIERVEPKDPPEVASQKLQGFVHVLVTIDSTGAVTSAETLTGPQALRSAAVQAIKQWTFRPVIRNGRGVSAYTDATVSIPAAGDFSPREDDAKFDPTAPFDLDKLRKLGFDMDAEMKAQQRIQELEAKYPRSAEQVLADTQEQKLGITGPGRLLALPELAKQAFDAGDLVQAASYANEVLQNTSNLKVSGTSIYDANTVLGRVALRQGSVSQARQYLLEASKTPAPGFDSIPDFTLARELLDKGDRDGVIEFLGQCKGYWKAGASQLDEMIAAVRAGKSF